ncbi:MAG: peptidase M15, partial [Proteobacteria bacterium]
TRKEARARPQDARPDPKPLVVAAQPQLARWALYGGEALANPDDGKNVPRLAYNFVRTAPTEVYTLGFRNDDMMANANRFTGSAVTFISVARFQK